MRTLSFIAIVTTLSAAGVAPTLQWVKTVSGSGLSTVTAASSDSNGNLYIAGSTTSIDFPAAGGAQLKSGGSPLVRINTTSSVSEKLFPAGLSAVANLAADPANSSILYATVTNSLYRSTDAGSTWSLVGQVTPSPSQTIASLTVDPSNGKTLYAAAITGILKSTDGGASWLVVRGGSSARVWVDPSSPQILLAVATDGLIRSADGGASWQVVGSGVFFTTTVVFDPFTPGTVYAGGSSGFFRSTDHGQTLTFLSMLPNQTQPSALIADPKHPGVLYAGAFNGIYQSSDSGSNWSPKSTTPAFLLAADPATGVLYAGGSGYGILASTDAFSTTSRVGALETSLRQIEVAGGNVFQVAAPSSDIFVVKLDASGNVVYATYFGGGADDSAEALAVGADGSVYVTGRTRSIDFPTSSGVYKRTVNEDFQQSPFVLKLNGDGSLGWATYFADRNTTAKSIAVDAAGNPHIGGLTAGNLPTTPGVYQTTFQQGPFCTGFFGCFPGPTSAFVTKFNAAGSNLIFSTYVPADSAKNNVTEARTLVLDKDGNVWFAGQSNVAELNGTGSSLLAATYQSGIGITALALDAASNVYVTGSASLTYAGLDHLQFNFPATPGAFQRGPQPATPLLPGQITPGGFSDAFVIKYDHSLATILAATLLGGELVDVAESIAIDPDGNVILSGESDSKAFPTRAPFQTSFAPRSGFIAGLDSSLSQLLFSTYLGDTRAFDAHTVTLDGKGGVLLAGSTLNSGGAFVGGQPGQSFDVGSLIVANKISLIAPPAARLDSVVHYASRLAAAIAPGQPILAIGSGFAAGAQLVVDGAALDTVVTSATALSAVMPDGARTDGAHTIQVSNGGVLSNPVYVPAAPASPGIYSVDGSGFGQGYILNSDGTLNSPSNPAAAGSAVTIYATGAGAFTIDNGFAVTALTPAVFVGGFYANGIASVDGPVDGFPGNVYRISVYVPDPATLASQNPNLKDFHFPPQVGVKLVMGQVGPGNPESSPLISQGGLVLNVK